jgi:hypothetical protein
MLWTMIVLLIVLWMLGLGSDDETGLFIHSLYAMAVALLVVSISREAAKNRTLKQVLRRRDQHRQATGGASPKPTGRYRHEFSGISDKS